MAAPLAPGGASPEEDTTKISMDILQKNMSQIDISRTFLCIVGGIVAGILRCTSLSGLLCFVVIYLTIAAILGIKIFFDYKQYLNTSFGLFVVSDLQKNILSFILFWTLTYALVYIY
jgi:ER membrane protein complex subunit 6